MSLELAPVLGAGAQKEGHAIVHTGQHDGCIAGDDPRGAAATETVGHHDGVVALTHRGVDGFLYALPEGVRGGVEACIEEVEVDDRGNMAGKFREFGLEHTTGDDLDLHFRLPHWARVAWGHSGNGERLSVGTIDPARRETATACGRAGHGSRCGGLRRPGRRALCGGPPRGGRWPLGPCRRRRRCRLLSPRPDRSPRSP